MLLVAVLLLLGEGAAWAQSPTVTFKVYVDSSLLTETTQVVVRGSQPELGNWKVPGQLVLSGSGEAGVYTGSARLEGANEGDPVEYKYVLIEAGQERWERNKLGNRRFWVEGKAQEVPLGLYDEQSEAGSRQTILSLTVQLDLHDFFIDEAYLEGVALMGGREPLSFDLENERTEMENMGEGLWQATIHFPYGTGKDVPFKFAWKQGGQWEWEWRPGTTTHVLWLDDRAPTQQVRLTYAAEPGQIISEEENGEAVDDIEAILSRQGARATHSRYQYERAMQALERADSKQAEQAYRVFQSKYAGGNEVDDYHYRQAEHLMQQGKSNQALELLSGQQARERDPYRKEYYGYRQAELLLMDGQGAQARARLKRIKATTAYPRLTRYANEGLAASYLEEADLDSLSQGVRLLEGMVATDSTQRGWLKQLRRGYQLLENEEQETRVLRRLTRVGTAGERAQSGVELARYRLTKGQREEALVALAAVDAQALGQGERSQLEATRIEIHSAMGQRQQVQEQAERWRQRWGEDSPGAGRVNYLDQKARTRSQGQTPPEAATDTTNVPRGGLDL